MKINDLRELFLKYFEENGHKIIDSAPLVPIDDPSVLWINAGITPLKKYFDGTIIPDNKRMVSSQKCIRTNDIENVGVTARHQTFFEMLGNFSVGDYFKKEAIQFAYDFLTNEKYLNFDIDKLYMTYYPSDEDTKKIWMEIGVKEEHLLPLDGNYWEIGEGPCGPCTEIFYDRGEEFDNRGIEILREDLDNDRYVEIWNVVFSQFNGSENLRRDEYPELPNKNIDTGMGLERVACILQDVPTNFEVDSFMLVNKEIEKLCGIAYTGQSSFKIITDHVRTACMAISDSAIPSNEGRGYVLRRLLRRAIRHGVKLGFNEPFMHKLVDVVNESLPCYDFTSQKDMVKTIIKNEEEKFFRTLESGEKKLEEFLSKGSLTGEEAFILYDTFGFPIELTIEVASESNIEVDTCEFNKHLEEQKNRSRSSRNEESGQKKQSEALLSLKEQSSFKGYHNIQCQCKVIAIIKDDSLVNSASGKIGLVFDQTPFYAESGGQVSDRGLIDLAEVLEVFKAPNGQHVHYIVADKEISIGDICLCKVDVEYRNNVTVNHSATHILNYSLNKVFGSHIKQQGSYVCNDYLRFDFAHFGSVGDEDIMEVERVARKSIEEWNLVSIEEMHKDEAIEMGAYAPFGEKYGDIVRVVKLGDSIELCGGCHISDFNQLENFAIVSYESKGSGIYRIVATTNDNINSVLTEELKIVVEDIKNMISKTEILANKLGESSKLDNVREKFNDLINNLSSYEDRVTLYELKNSLLDIKKNLDKKEKEIAANNAVSTLDVIDYIQDINDLKIVIYQDDTLDVDAAKAVIDAQFDKYQLDVMVFISSKNKVVFLAKASDKAIDKGIKCGDLVKEAAIICGGNGGGRPNFAQAGAKDKTKISEAVEKLTFSINSIC